MAIYLLGCALFWMLSCQLFVTCRGLLWSTMQHVIPAHFIVIFITTSSPFSIILIVYALPINCGQFAPLLVYFGYLFAISCYFDSETISTNFKFGLGCTGSSANNAFSQVSNTNNHKIINLIFQLQSMQLWTLLQMAMLASF